MKTATTVKAIIVFVVLGYVVFYLLVGTLFINVVKTVHSKGLKSIINSVWEGSSK